MPIRPEAARKLARDILDALDIPETTLLVSLLATKIQRAVALDEAEQAVIAAGGCAESLGAHQLAIVK